MKGGQIYDGCFVADAAVWEMVGQNRPWRNQDVLSEWPGQEGQENNGHQEGYLVALRMVGKVWLMVNQEVFSELEVSAKMSTKLTGKLHGN